MKREHRCNFLDNQSKMCFSFSFRLDNYFGSNLYSNVQVIVSAFCFASCLLKKWFKNINHMFLIFLMNIFRFTGQPLINFIVS